MCSHTAVQHLFNYSGGKMRQSMTQLTSDHECQKWYIYLLNIFSAKFSASLTTSSALIFFLLGAYTVTERSDKNSGSSCCNSLLSLVHLPALSPHLPALSPCLHFPPPPQAEPWSSTVPLLRVFPLLFLGFLASRRGIRMHSPLYDFLISFLGTNRELSRKPVNFLHHLCVDWLQIL